MDAAAPENARKFYDQSGVTFTRGVDRSDTLWETLDFQVVPNGLFVDEQGVVRYAKFGGFEARQHADEIERLLAAPAAPIVTVRPASVSGSNPEARRWFRLGVEALEKGDKQAAAGHWRKALELEPKNLVIRKQIWALEHPEQFYPRINFEWQREQLAREGKQ